jgi:broad specificity phosphatase PhoE
MRENVKKSGKGIREYKCSEAESLEDVNKRAEAFLHTLIANHLSNKE